MYVSIWWLPFTDKPFEYCYAGVDCLLSLQGRLACLLDGAALHQQQAVQVTHTGFDCGEHFLIDRCGLACGAACQYEVPYRVLTVTQNLRRRRPMRTTPAGSCPKWRPLCRQQGREALPRL